MKEPTRPADPLSILSLGAGIGALVLALFSVLPLAGMCLMPLSAISMLVALISGIASVIRTTLKPELDGRLQALTGIMLALIWCGVAVMFFVFVYRNQ